MCLTVVVKWVCIYYELFLLRIFRGVLPLFKILNVKHEIQLLMTYLIHDSVFCYSNKLLFRQYTSVIFMSLA